jgi:hypothetical protein
MEPLYWLIPLIVIAMLVLIFWFIGRASTRRVSVAHARAAFDRERQQLEALFFQVASRSGKPRGLSWKECVWSDLLAWVREKETGQLLVLVAVTISFEAIEGGDMEGVEAGQPAQCVGGVLLSRRSLANRRTRHLQLEPG